MILPATGMNTSETSPNNCSRNEAPTPPVITGPPRGKPGVEYEFTFQSTDPEGEDIIYCMKWGDGVEFCIGPYPSGEVATSSHIWEEEGDYTIEATATDPHEETSDPSYHDISIPRARARNLPMFLQNLFLRFPNAFPILRQLLSI